MKADLLVWMVWWHYQVWVVEAIWRMRDAPVDVGGDHGTAHRVRPIAQEWGEYPGRRQAL